MATTINSVTLSAAVGWDVSNVLDLGEGKHKYTLAYSDSIADGTGVDSCKMVWTDVGTIANGGTAAIDLAGSLTDAFGNTAVFTKVKGLFIINKGIASGSTYTETSGENIIVSTSTVLCLASNGMIIEPGGCIYFTSPKVGAAVTATSADTITLSRAGSSTVTYQIAIWGLL